MARKQRLSYDRIVDAAASVADRGGLEAVSMRSVGSELGVEAMSLYHYVSSKEALLDALSEWVFSKIIIPEAGVPWRQALWERAHSAREVLGAHSWGLGMLESRPAPGLSQLRHYDAMMGHLSAAGFSARLATTAFATVDSFVFGFVLTESTLPLDGTPGAERKLAESAGPDENEFPHLSAMLAELFSSGSYSFGDEFSAGLTMVLEGIEQRLVGERDLRAPHTPTPSNLT
jgi:AcrR family transcriptional regulator